MNRMNTPHKGQTSSAKEVSDYARNLKKNSFMTHSDETIDELFRLLNTLSSPAKEEAFVQFCLVGKIPTVVYN